LNLKFTISYDGSSFYGSQKQPNKPTVEAELLKTFRAFNINTKIILSGRTDKGVHATGQVFNCQIPFLWDNVEKFKELLNKRLHQGIRILKIEEAHEDFHSRFSAKKRVYRYLITQKELTSFNSKFLLQHKNIDEEAIKQAIKEFVGVYDFKYFFKTGSEKENTIREVFNAKFYKYKGLYIFRFEANSYLRSQIRLMVGFLLAISDKKLTIEDLRDQLKSTKQSFTTPIPSNGLYLAKVKY